jgi:hypothetical protein
MPSRRYREGDFATAIVIAIGRSVPATPREANVTIGDNPSGWRISAGTVPRIAGGIGNIGQGFFRQSAAAEPHSNFPRGAPNNQDQL